MRRLPLRGSVVVLIRHLKIMLRRYYAAIANPGANDVTLQPFCQFRLL
jgi:hypothetical protein